MKFLRFENEMDCHCQNKYFDVLSSEFKPLINILYRQRSTFFYFLHQLNLALSLNNSLCTLNIKF